MTKPPHQVDFLIITNYGVESEIHRKPMNQKLPNDLNLIHFYVSNRCSVFVNLARYSRDLHRHEDYNETLKRTFGFCGDECDDRVLPLPLPECFGANGRNIARQGSHD